MLSDAPRRGFMPQPEEVSKRRLSSSAFLSSKCPFYVLHNRYNDIPDLQDKPKNLTGPNLSFAYLLVDMAKYLFDRHIDRIAKRLPGPMSGYRLGPFFRRNGSTLPSAGLINGFYFRFPVIPRKMEILSQRRRRELGVQNPVCPEMGQMTAIGVDYGQHFCEPFGCRRRPDALLLQPPHSLAEQPDGPKRWITSVRPYDRPEKRSSLRIVLQHDLIGMQGQMQFR